VADSNVSLCHSSIHAPLIHGIKQQVDSLVRHAVLQLPRITLHFESHQSLLLTASLLRCTALVAQ
jgi:hypothetical protein